MTRKWNKQKVVNKNNICDGIHISRVLIGTPVLKNRRRNKPNNQDWNCLPSLTIPTYLPTYVLLLPAHIGSPSILVIEPLSSPIKLPNLVALEGMMMRTVTVTVTML